MQVPFWKDTLMTIVDALLSIKLWGLAAYFIITFQMVMDGKLSGDIWAAANVTVFSLIFGMKYVFAKVKIGILSGSSEEEVVVVEQKYWMTVWHKFISNFVDIKFWGLFFFTWIATYFAYLHLGDSPTAVLSGEGWAQATGTIYTLIFGMRENFKIHRIKIAPLSEVARMKE